MTDLSSRAGAHGYSRVTHTITAVSALAFTLLGADTVLAADADYEPLPVLQASELLPEDLLRGDLHTVLETVENNGFENSFTIESDFGVFTAQRQDFVPERVQEVYALKELEKVSQSDAFAQGVAQAATSPFRALKGLATEPVGTVTGVVKGVGALFSQAGEMVSGSRGELEGSAAQELVGFGAVKRQIAELLDVDPYTTNEVLQDAMGEVAWAGFAGGLSLAPLTAQVGGGVGTALSGLQNARTLNSLLTSQSPEALRDFNRRQLEGIGVDADVADDFVEHDWFSPRHETVIVAALVGMDGVENRDVLAAHATISESEAQSIFLMRQAEAMLGFHQNVSPVSSMVNSDGTVVLTTADDRAVTVLPADYLIWSAGAAAIADQAAPQDLPQELWLTGAITDVARTEFEKRGWTVMADAGDQLAPEFAAGFVEVEASSETEQNDP